MLAFAHPSVISRGLVLSAVLVGFALAGCGEGSTSTGHDAAVQVPDLAAPDLAAPTQTECDVVAQDCAQAGTKCTIVIAADANGKDVQTCVTTKGAVAEGQTCTRTSFGVDDNCAAGLVCSSRGTLDGGLVCTRYCKHDTDCASGHLCQLETPTFPGVGLCVKPCTAFGTECASGLTCAFFYPHVPATGQDFPVCRPVGTKPLGESCTSSLDCGADATCIASQGATAGICRVHCDATHPCPATDAGGTCTPIADGTSICE